MNAPGELFAWQVHVHAGGWQVRTKRPDGRDEVLYAGLNSRRQAEAIIAELLARWAQGVVEARA